MLLNRSYKKRAKDLKQIAYGLKTKIVHDEIRNFNFVGELQTKIRFNYNILKNSYDEDEGLNRVYLH